MSKYDELERALKSSPKEIVVYVDRAWSETDSDTLYLNVDGKEIDNLDIEMAVEIIVRCACPNAIVA